MFKRLKEKIKNKISFWNIENLKKVIREFGPAFLVIFIGWEIIEDILFPVLFYYLGEHIPAFYALIPVSWLLCLHPVAVPVLLWAYVKISNKNKDLEKPNKNKDLEKVNKNKHLWHACDHEH